MNNRQLYQWVKRESKGWGEVNRHFRANVVVFSRGVVAAQSSQIRKIAGCVGGRSDSQRRRLQRYVAQTGSLRGFFNWRVYRANSAADYPAAGQARLIIGLLNAVRAGLPRGLKVRVLADRGIGTSPLLMRGIMALGWTFLFRVTRLSKLILADGQEVTFYDQVTAPGQTYAASGLVFKQRGRIPAHVRVVWGLQAKAPWSLVTNEPALRGFEYAQRMWQEEAFRDLKSYGFDLEHAALDDPNRLAFLLVLLVVAYAWLLLWGRARELAHLTAAPKQLKDGSLVRRYSLFREGRQAFLSTLPFF